MDCGLSDLASGENTTVNKHGAGPMTITLCTNSGRPALERGGGIQDLYEINSYRDVHAQAQTHVHAHTHAYMHMDMDM